VTHRSSRRNAARAAAALSAIVIPLVVAAAPALAIDDGEVKGKSLGIGLTIAIFILIPVGAFAVIAFFSTLPSMLRRPRYRPGRPWNYDPLWFNGPDNPNEALMSARPRVTAKGGASAEW
jgi:hypothetical protein